MNVCFVEGDMSRRGGTERMTSLLANALSNSHNVYVVSLSFAGEELFFKLNESVEHIILPSNGDKLDNICKIRELHRFIKDKKIDWLINVDVGCCIFGIPAAKGTKTKVITWEHANYYNNWNSKVFPCFRKYAAKCSDCVVVLTEKDKNNYLKNIKTKKPIVVIPNPVETREYKYDINSKIILSAGLLLPIKGFEKAIEAASVVLPKYPEWKWEICGDGPERNKLIALIHKYGLEKQFILLGTVNNMQDKYQKSAMYVMTSKMEGLPMVLLEAKSYGLPIVSFDIMTGPSDIVQDGINGYLVEKDNVVELAEKIEMLIADSEMRKQFSANSQIEIEKFSFEKTLEKWENILNAKSIN